MIEPKWYVADNPPGENYPAWLRIAAVFDGKVYIPAGCIGAEDAIVRQAVGAGVMVIYADDHAYIPVAWARAHIGPDQGDALAGIERSVLQVAALELMGGERLPGALQ